MIDVLIVGLIVLGFAAIFVGIEAIWAFMTDARPEQTSLWRILWRRVRSR